MREESFSYYDMIAIYNTNMKQPSVIPLSSKSDLFPFHLLKIWSFVSCRVDGSGKRSKSVVKICNIHIIMKGSTRLVFKVKQQQHTNK